MTECTCPGEGQDLPNSQHMDECPMNPRQMTQVIHKLIVPTPNGSYLTDLILCWANRGSITTTALLIGVPVANVLTTLWSRDINDVTCSDCRQLWFRGVYQ